MLSADHWRPGLKTQPRISIVEIGLPSAECRACMPGLRHEIGLNLFSSKSNLAYSNPVKRRQLATGRWSCVYRSNNVNYRVLESGKWCGSPSC